MSSNRIPDQLAEGYEEFSGDFADLTDKKLSLGDLGDYYEGVIDLEGARFKVFHGDYVEETDEDPAFRLVIERMDVHRDHRYWRVIVDSEGNSLVEKGSDSHLTDESILEAAGEVLREGELVE